MGNNNVVVNEIQIKDPQQAQDIISAETMINQQLTIISELREKQRVEKAALADTYKNDKEYRELDEKAKSAASVRSNYKKGFLKQPSVAEAVTRVAGLKDDIKDAKAYLSAALKRYKELSKANKFETKDGQLCLIEEMYKLVVKPAK